MVVPGVEEEVAFLRVEGEAIGVEDEGFESGLDDDGVLRAVEEVEDGLGERQGVDCGGGFGWCCG